MFYKLKNDYQLRGWQRLPYAMVDRSDGKIIFLSKEAFSLLNRCTGLLDSEGILFTDADRKMLKLLHEKDLLDCFEQMTEPLADDQAYRYYDNRFIRLAHWAITGRCNYKCRHCYMSAPDALFGEIPFEECRKVIDSLEQCGIFNVSLTGGEALVHPDFWNIVDLLIEKRIRITSVYSNGFLIDERFFENCEKRGIKPQISLSFDGCGGWHEWLRGGPEAFEHIKRAFRLCREHGFKTDAEMCLHKKNLPFLMESIHFLQDNGCTAVKINNLTCAGEGVALRDLSFSTEEYFDVIKEFIPLCRKENISIPCTFSGITITKDKVVLGLCKHEDDCISMDRSVLCMSMRNNMYIHADGTVLPCLSFSNVEGYEKRYPNITETSLKKILNDSAYITDICTTMDEYLDRNEECRNCEYKYRCASGCRGIAVKSFSGDGFLAKDEFSCAFYKTGLYDELKKQKT